MLKPETIQHAAAVHIQREFPELAGVRILDVGAGQGNLISELASRGAAGVALEYAAPSLPGVKTVSHDLNLGSLPFDGDTFDVVVATEVLEHLRMQYGVLHEMVRVLRPGGLLVLTIPNYWNVHYRIRYLLTGNLQRPLLGNAANREAYLNGLAPHINTITYPTLKVVLTWEGCADFQLRSDRPFAFGQKLLYLPWYALILLATACYGRSRRIKFMLPETNGAAALSGRRHILVACRKGAATPENRG